MRCRNHRLVRRRFRAAEASGEVKQVASVLTEALNSQNLTWRLNSEAVGCMLSVCRKLKTEIPAHSQSGGETRMGIVAWIILGLVAGFIGSKIVNKSGEGFFLDIILGIVGAVVGGWLFSYFGAHGVTGLNIYSLVVAVLGAIVVLVVYHAIRRVV